MSKEVLKPDSTSKKWVGPSPQELAPNVIPLGALSNRSLLSRKKRSYRGFGKLPSGKIDGGKFVF